MWERRSRTSACGSFAALSRPSGPARYRIPGLRDWLVRPRSRQPFRGLGIFLQIDHSQDLAYIFRQEVYGEAAVRSQVPPLIGNGCKHRQIRFTEKFFLGDTVVHKATLELEKKSGIARALQGRTSEKELLLISLVPILFGLGNYKKTNQERKVKPLG
uniref:Uncharacterized protein n=1 Tax=Oryza barthii TaxID=65489 RepID=A0A0D3HTM5_9ORYZ